MASRITVSTRISPETLKALSSLARHEDRTLAYLLRQAVEHFTAEHRRGRTAGRASAAPQPAAEPEQ